MLILGDILRLALSIVLAFFAGRLISRLKLPAILGWLITGMLIGPHALNLLGNSVLDSQWFGVLEDIFECTFGLMIGTELIWKQMKKAGAQIAITTLTESLGTFLIVSLVFGIVFRVTGLPLYLAFLFGGIALATAPAPSLSVVRDMQADGRSPAPWSPWLPWMTWWVHWCSSWCWSGYLPISPPGIFRCR